MLRFIVILVLVGLCQGQESDEEEEIDLCDTRMKAFKDDISNTLDVYHFGKHGMVWFIGDNDIFQLNYRDKDKSKFRYSRYTYEFSQCFREYSALIPEQNDEHQYRFLYGGSHEAELTILTTYHELDTGRWPGGEDCMNNDTRPLFTELINADFQRYFPGFITSASGQLFWHIYIVNDVADRHLLKFEAQSIEPTSTGLLQLVRHPVFFLFMNCDSDKIMSGTFNSFLPVGFRPVTAKVGVFYAGWIKKHPNGGNATAEILCFLNDTQEVIEIDAQVLQVRNQPFELTRTPIEQYFLDCDPYPLVESVKKAVSPSIWIALGIVSFSLIIGAGFIVYERNKPPTTMQTNWMHTSVSNVLEEKKKSTRKMQKTVERL